MGFPAAAKKFLFWIPGVIAALFLTAITVTPEDVKTNAGKWASYIGVDAWPTWLTDRRAGLVVIMAVVAFYVWLWSHGRWGVRLKALQAAVSQVGRIRLTVIHPDDPLLEKRRIALDEKEAHLNKLQEGMEAIARDRKDFFEMNEKLYQELHFGREFKKFTPLAEMPLQVMSASVSELLPSLNDMMRETGLAWDSIRAAARAQNLTNPAVYELSDRVFECEYQRALSAVDRLKFALSRGYDPRPLLVLVYACYRDLRRLIVQLTDMTGGPATALNGYSNWREAEKSFSDELTRKLSIPSLVAVTNEIQDEDMRQKGSLKRTPPYTLTTPSEPSNE